MQLLQAYLISHINEPKTIMRPERKSWGGGKVVTSLFLPRKGTLGDNQST